MISDITVCERFNISKRLNPLVIIANDESPSDQAVIQAAIRVLNPVPYITRKVWMENEGGWDDPEHWRQIRENPQDWKAISLNNYASRHERLCGYVEKFQPGEIVVVGSAHVLFQSKYSLYHRENDDVCVEKFREALKNRGIPVVILCCSRFGEVSLTDINFRVNRIVTPILEVENSKLNGASRKGVFENIVQVLHPIIARYFN